MIRKPLYLLAASLVLAGSANMEAFAQKDKYRNKANDPVEKLGYEKKLRWADGLFKEGSYYNAVEYYTQLQQEQPRNPYLAYQIADCNYKLRDYAPAATSYGYAYDLAKAIYPEAKYKQALMLKMNGDYDNAILAFQKFIDDNPKTFKKLKKDAEREIEGCKMGQTSMNDPIQATVKNVGKNINSAYTELSPMPLGDTALLYATMHTNGVVDKGREKRSDYVSRLMVSQKNKFAEDTDTLSWPLPFLDGQFNDEKYHVGNGVFSEGGDRFYFTKCIEDDKNEMMCHIFVSEFKNDRWSKPEELGYEINVDKFSSTHPNIVTIGKKEILFFSSNRELQGRGGYDIWYSVYDTRLKTYRRPQNAGKQINTTGDEMTPYFDNRTNTLYFASNGQVGMGGFDIFKANIVGSSPSKYESIQNLGYPINSPADELYFVKDPIGKGDAYVVSNRPGSVALKNPTCCDDIWRIKYDPQLKASGRVLSQKTQQLVPNAVVKMVDEKGEVKTYNTTDGTFEFATPRGHSYTITADKAGYTSTHANVNTTYIKRTDDDQTFPVTIYVDSYSIDKAFRMDNVFYDYDKSTLRPESIGDLEALATLMKDNPALRVQIQSHTDSKGTDAYNLKLSQDRAQSVVDYLVNNLGISRSRLTAKGMGQSKPVAPNTVDGRDNSAGRQLNRRTEFRIIEEDPTARIIFDSSKPGTIGSQQKMLTVPEQADIDGTGDNESHLGRPGSRTNN